MQLLAEIQAVFHPEFQPQPYDRAPKLWLLPEIGGLNKPVNDLSRGCNAADVYNLALITASQALAK